MISMNQKIAAEYMIETMFNDDNLKEESNTKTSIAAWSHYFAATRRNQDNSQHALELYLRSLNTYLRIISLSTFEFSSNIR